MRSCYPFRLYVIHRWQRPVHFVLFLCKVLVGLPFWERMFRNHVVACRPISRVDSVVSDLSLPNLQEVMDARLYIGRCPNQVVEFIQEQVLPRLSGAAQGPIGQIRV